MNERVCYCCRQSGCELIVHSTADFPSPWWFVCKVCEVCEGAGASIGSSWYDLPPGEDGRRRGRIISYHVRCPLHPKPQGPQPV